MRERLLEKESSASLMIASLEVKNFCTQPQHEAETTPQTSYDFFYIEQEHTFHRSDERERKRECEREREREREEGRTSDRKITSGRIIDLLLLPIHIVYRDGGGNLRHFSHGHTNLHVCRDR